jgi:hypothetical protein
MSLNLDIPGDLEAQLRSEASKHGIPLPDYIIQVLSSSSPSASTASGSEVVAYWKREGLLGTRSDIQDSQLHARSLRAQAERRDRS